MPILIKLSSSLSERGITKNKLATEGKFRVATLHELENGKAKSITFEMLEKILSTANAIAKSEGKRTMTLTDIIDYVPESTTESELIDKYGFGSSPIKLIETLDNSRASKKKS